MQRTRLYSIFVLLIILLQVSAQNSPKISGKVTANNGEILVGVSINIENTSRGTMTDSEGNYSIVADIGEKLIYSYIGFNPETRTVGNNTIINVVLREDDKYLDEVVVVGFGTQKRRDIVGAITSVSAKDLTAAGQTNILQALQGSVPGLRIDNPASPSGEPAVRIRGLNTLTSSNASPLYIVDGVPFYDMRALDPNDIQSIEILKDASATAIYGSQAANGVLLITTKRGSATGKPTVNLSMSYSLQNPINEPELMNGAQYIAFKKEAFRYKTPAAYEAITNEDDLIREVLTASEYAQYAAGNEVDPYEMMLHRNAPVTETSVSVSGGEKAKYYIGANYLNNQGLVKSTYFDRFSIRANIDLDINDYIRLSNYTNLFEYKSSDLVGGNNGLSAMYRLSPYSMMYDENGNYNMYPMPDDALYGNPFLDAYSVEKSKTRLGANNLSILRINVPGVKGLALEGKYQFERRQQKDGRFAFTDTPEGATGSIATRQYQDWSKWYAEGLASYVRGFGKHNIDVTAMASAEYRDYETSTLLATGIPVSDYLWYKPETATNPLQATTGYNERAIIGLMFRANYNFNSKYYLTFTVRRDGFSGFSENQKFATFPSAAVAWRINEESFLADISAIDNLKLRFSYGQIGSQGVDIYETLAKLDNTAGAVFGKIVEPGYVMSALPNNLKWETTTATNIGLDYGFFNNRIAGSLEFYHKVSDELLISRNIPIMMGVTSLRDNSAKVQNQGFEINLNVSPVRTRDFEWQVGVNYSYNDNKILEIYGEKNDDIGNRWFIGEPIGVVYTYKCIGLWQESDMGTEEAILYGAESGKPRFEDVPDENGEIDYVINDQDRQIVGYTVPPHLLGLRTSFSYKNFTLSIAGNGAFGHVKRATYQYYNDPRFRNFNFSYWTPETPENKFPRPGTIAGDTESQHGSLFTFAADWFKIKNLTLGYDVPAKLLQPLHIQSLAVYCSLQDYFSFYSYPFVDPETGSGLGAYPNNKECKFGIRLSF